MYFRMATVGMLESVLTSLRSVQFFSVLAPCSDVPSWSDECCIGLHGHLAYKRQEAAVFMWEWDKTPYPYESPKRCLKGFDPPPCSFCSSGACGTLVMTQRVIDCCSSWTVTALAVDFVKTLLRFLPLSLAARLAESGERPGPPLRIVVNSNKLYQRPGDVDWTAGQIRSPVVMTPNMPNYGKNNKNTEALHDIN